MIKKSKFSFFFSFIILIVFFSLGFNLLSFNINKKIDKNNEKQEIYLASGSEFESTMKQIYDNPTVDVSTDYLDYDASSKVYNLKQDVDFQDETNSSTIDLYDGSHSVGFVEKSTFNGNNFKILNRYDKEDLETNFYKFGYDYKTSKVYKATTDMSLFNYTNGANVYNLTFDNSPFAFGFIENGSQIYNVNLTNVDISNLEVTIDSSFWSQGVSDASGDLTIKNQLVIPLYASNLDGQIEDASSNQTPTKISNSYISNIKFNNNTFNLQNQTTNQTDPLMNAHNVGVAIGIFGSSYSAIEQKEVKLNIENLEVENINITNNVINIDSNNNISDAPKTAFSFSPLLITQGSYLDDTVASESGNYLTENDVWVTNSFNDGNSNRDQYEMSIFFNEIYIHDISFVNNKTYLNSILSLTPNYFNIQPIFVQDDIGVNAFQKVVLNNIWVDENTNVTSFQTRDANTYYSQTNDIIWNGGDSNNTSQLVQQLVSSKFWREEDNWNLNSYKKNLFFLSQYWNTNENESLILKRGVSAPSLSTSKDNLTNDLILNIKLSTNNYKTLNDTAYLAISDNNGNEIYKQSILSDIDSVSVNIDALNLSYKNTYTLEFHLSDYNNNINFIIPLNDSISRIYSLNDFSNSINSDNLEISFKMSDPLNEVSKININLYNKQNLVDSKEIDANTITNNVKTNSTYQISFANVSKLDRNNFYLVVQVYSYGKYVNVDSSEQSSISFLGENYLQVLSKPNTFMYYYWWIVIILIVLLLLSIIIVIMIINNKNKRKETEKINNKIHKLELEYGIKEYTEDETNYYSNQDSYDYYSETQEYYPQDDDYYDYQNDDYNDDYSDGYEYLDSEENYYSDSYYDEISEVK